MTRTSAVPAPTGDAAIPHAARLSSVLERVTAQAVGNRAGRAEPLLPQDWMADAAEELTFQFSASVEAQSKCLEDRLDTSSTDLSEIRVERIRQFLLLIDARSSEQLRHSAQALADAYVKSSLGQTEMSEHAVESIAPEPGKRYAMLRLAGQALQERGEQAAVRKLVGDLQSLCATHGSRIRASLNVAAVAREYSAGNAASHDEFIAAYYQMIESTPTVRMIYDRLVELGRESGPSRAQHMLQRALWMDLQALSPSMNRVQLLQAASAVTVGCQVCNTMHRLANELIRRFSDTFLGADNAQRADSSVRCTRELLGIGDSMSPPRSLLERLGAQLMGKNVDSSKYSIFYNTLYRQALQWPASVWAVPDRKDAVLNQLIKLSLRHAAV